MNKGELISKIADEAGLTKVQAAAAVNAFMAAVGGALKDGDKVSLVGFGTFSAGTSKARTGRNPKTGATLEIAAKTSAKFKASKELNDNL